MGLKPSDAEISAILSEIDVTYHGQLEIQDYLQVEKWRETQNGKWDYMLNVSREIMGNQNSSEMFCLVNCCW